MNQDDDELQVSEDEMLANKMESLPQGASYGIPRALLIKVLLVSLILNAYVLRVLFNTG